MIRRLSNAIMFYSILLSLVFVGILLFNKYFKQETVSFDIMLDTGQQATFVIVLSKPSNKKIDLRYFVRSKAIRIKNINELNDNLPAWLKAKGYFVENIKITPKTRTK